MKKFKDIISESSKMAPFDALIEGLKDSDIAYDFSGRVIPGVDDIYEITAQMHVNSQYTSIENFKESLELITAFMEENFNYHRSNIGNSLKNGNIGLVYDMSKEELETSKMFIPYITIDKYNL